MRPTLAHILAVVADECQLPVAYITGPMRWKAYCEARHTFIHAARAFRYTLTPIGYAINRDHATVQHSLRKDPAKLPKLNIVLSRLLAREAA